jgi:prophage antirepressor-like protein
MMEQHTSGVQQKENLEILLQSINYDFEGAKIRIVGTPDTPWFCGKDVANILEYKDTDQALRKHVRDRNKKKLIEILDISRPVILTGLEEFTSNELEMIYINEAGLYSLILKSKNNGKTKEFFYTKLALIL